MISIEVGLMLDAQDYSMFNRFQDVGAEVHGQAGLEGLSSRHPFATQFLTFHL